MIKFKWYSFSDLTPSQLYEILAIRSEIFVVEQNCVYLDPDGKDQYAWHLVGTENNAMVAYIRLFPPTEIENYLVFGRVLTSFPARSKGYGKILMKELLDYCQTHYPDKDIRCSAQLYLKKFYESFGFKTEGDAYNEDGILHINMYKPPINYSN